MTCMFTNPFDYCIILSELFSLIRSIIVLQCQNYFHLSVRLLYYTVRIVFTNPFDYCITLSDF